MFLIGCCWTISNICASGFFPGFSHVGLLLHWAVRHRLLGALLGESKWGTIISFRMFRFIFSCNTTWRGNKINDQRSSFLEASFFWRLTPCGRLSFGSIDQHTSEIPGTRCRRAVTLSWRQLSRAHSPRTHRYSQTVHDYHWLLLTTTRCYECR